jgi:hypothetical protein
MVFSELDGRFRSIEELGGIISTCEKKIILIHYFEFGNCSHK